MPTKKARAALRDARLRRRSLEQAVARGQSDLAAQDLAIIGLLHDRALLASRSARSCTSIPELGLPGERSVRTTVQPLPPAP